ncbi:Hypothetical predicted protein [Mytilus galloprovincialis]|uniref:Uncharacterized protein n=1 Tax=Mytilus galloprovincialis TaxID=29158 RepID=A0A8B6FNN9_MYTGA|nr:Hypothetical predicted protein [Mytilus galloprovincialis]
MDGKGTHKDPIICSSGESTSFLDLTALRPYIPTYGPPESDAELASSESSSILPHIRFGQLSSPQYVPVPAESPQYVSEESPMEVVQEVLEQISSRLLTDSDLDSSFSFLRFQPATPLVSTPSLATPVREVMLRDRPDDEDILQQLLPAAIPQEVDLTHPAIEQEFQCVKEICIVTTMSTQIQGLRSVVRRNSGLGRVTTALQGLEDGDPMAVHTAGARDHRRQRGIELLLRYFQCKFCFH